MENNELMQAILQTVTELKEDMNKRFDNLEQRQERLEQGQVKLGQCQERLEQGIKELRGIVVPIGDAIILSTESLDKRLLETKNELKADIKDMQTVTARNCYSIELLKERV